MAVWQDWRAGRLLKSEDMPAAEDEVDTQPLRIAAIFVILSAGVLGGFPPLFLKIFRDQDGLTTRLLRAFSAGVILTLALVHIIPEAIEKLSGLLDTSHPDYPLGGTTVLFGVALMVLLEHLAHIAHLSHPGCAASSTGECVAVDSGYSPAAAHHHHGDSTIGLTSPAATYDHETVKVAVCGVNDVAGAADRTERLGKEATPHGSGGDGRGRRAPRTADNVRQKVIAYMFELGCIIHSFIIGLALGVHKTNVAEVRALLIALAFHQWLEGLSLATVILRGGFPILWKGVCMVVMYSLTCPIGIAIGMGISNSYDEESIRARAIEGTFDGVSGGMLLYISLVQLLAEDMIRLATQGHAHPHGHGGKDGALSALRGNGAMRMMFCMAFWGGAAAMCILAIWA